MLEERTYPIQTFLTKTEMMRLAVSGVVNRNLWDQLSEGISILEYNEQEVERASS